MTEIHKQLQSVIIDLRLFIPGGPRDLEIPVAPDDSVENFLDLIWTEVLAPRGIKPFKYGSVWLLRDPNYGLIFNRMGRRWMLQQYGSAEDRRLLAQVGISPGMVLQIIPFELSGA